jgi:hypothetical protein
MQLTGMMNEIVKKNPIAKKGLKNFVGKAIDLLIYDLWINHSRSLQTGMDIPQNYPKIMLETGYFTNPVKLNSDLSPTAINFATRLQGFISNNI